MSLPTCATNCSNNLPIVDFNKCAPEINNGQLTKLRFTTVGNPLSDWSSQAEWDSRLENDAVGASKIRTLWGIGDMPAPEATEKEISAGRKIYGKRNFTINFRVDETNSTNHDAFREIQCNTGNYLVWPETRDGKILGGSEGIEAKIKADIIIPEDYSDIIIYQLTVTWQTQFMPEMIDSPIAEDDGDQF